MNLKSIKNKLIELKVQRGQFDVLLESYQKDLVSTQEYLSDAEKAREIIQTVAKETQENIKLHLTSIVNLAIQSVFPDPPEFVLNIEQRRNVAEIDLLFKKEDNLMDPIKSSGGGLIDITSFALRLSVWNLNKTDSIMILDEPFRNVSHDLQDKVGQFLTTIARELNMQFIIVSHQPSVNEYAERTFRCKLNGNITELESL